jgi:hypothetical protein
MTQKKHNAEEGSTTVPPHMSLHEERKMEKKLSVQEERKKESSLQEERRKEMPCLPSSPYDGILMIW